ncbi:hypothetical protein [Anaerovorax sp. IOR16]|uniref:hypothetical protein n=1 Tax=Anaerovorax sp. IOR16 TaxID=2773458 RepID=UPI0019D0B5B5|nr:hypothetical protein [Anaerovorax sp. IOR16]
MDETYNEDIMENVRQNLGIEPDDESMDSEIMEMDKREVLERYFNWLGVIGFADTIVNAVDGIFGTTLEDDF